MEVVGKIFSDKNDMGNNSGQLRVGREHENNNGTAIRHHHFNILLYRTLTTFKNDISNAMGTVTAVGKTIYFLGSLILGSSFLMALQIKLLDINFDAAPPTFKNVMYSLSCCVLIIWCGRGIVSILTSYEKLRKDKMENEEFKIELQKKIDEHNSRRASKNQNL